MGHSSAPLSWPLLFLSFVRWPGTRVLGSTPERQALGQGGSVSPGWGVISRRPTEGQVAQLPEVPGLRCWAPRQARPCALVISAQAQSGCIFASRLRECKCPGAPAAQPLVNHTCGLQPVLRPPLQLTGPLGTNPCTVSLTLSLTRLPPPHPHTLCSCSWVWPCTLPLWPPWQPVRGCEVSPVASVCISPTPDDACHLQCLLLRRVFKS